MRDVWSQSPPIKQLDGQSVAVLSVRHEQPEQESELTICLFGGIQKKNRWAVDNCESDSRFKLNFEGTHSHLLLGNFTDGMKQFFLFFFF